MLNKQQGHLGLYLLTLFCTFAGIACIGFIIYTIPNTLFGFQYDVPPIVTHIKVWYQAHYAYEAHSAELGSLEILGLYAPLLLAALLFFLLASYLDRYLETHHEAGVPDIPESELKAHESFTRYTSLPETTARVSEFKPILLIIGILLIVVLFIVLGEFIVFLNFFR